MSATIVPNPATRSSLAAALKEPLGDSTPSGRRHPRRRLFRAWRRTRAPTETVLPLTALPPLPTETAAKNAHNPGVPNRPKEAEEGAGALDTIQLAVLIAMPRAKKADANGVSNSAARSEVAAAMTTPNPNSARSNDFDEVGQLLPEIVLGMAEALWDGGAEWKPIEPSSATTDFTPSSI